MLICLDITFTLLIFFLEQEIDTLQRLGLQLVDDVVENLEPCDVNHTVIIWRVRNLNSNTENTNENRGKMWTWYKRVICALKLCFASNFLKHSKNHSDESADDVDLLHDVSNKWIFPGKMQLIKLQRVIEIEDICIEWDHLLIYHGIQLADASLNYSFLGLIVSDGKHNLCEHERTLQGVTVEALLALGRQMLDLVEHRLDIVEKSLVRVFLVLIKQDHLFECTKNAIFVF